MLHAPNYETEPMEIGKLKGYHLGTENGREYYEGVDGRKFSFPSADFTKITFEDEGKEVVKLPTEKTDEKKPVIRALSAFDITPEANIPFSSLLRMTSSKAMCKFSLAAFRSIFCRR